MEFKRPKREAGAEASEHPIISFGLSRPPFWVARFAGGLDGSCSIFDPSPIHFGVESFPRPGCRFLWAVHLMPSTPMGRRPRNPRRGSSATSILKSSAASLGLGCHQCGCYRGQFSMAFLQLKFLSFKFRTSAHLGVGGGRRRPSWKNVFFYFGIARDLVEPGLVGLGLQGEVGRERGRGRWLRPLFRAAAAGAGGIRKGSPNLDG